VGHVLSIFDERRGLASWAEEKRKREGRRAAEQTPLRRRIMVWVFRGADADDK
jgi:hypothetical protein